jgi:hypothetical protein
MSQGGTFSSYHYIPRLIPTGYSDNRKMFHLGEGSTAPGAVVSRGPSVADRPDQHERRLCRPARVIIRKCSRGDNWSCQAHIRPGPPDDVDRRPRGSSSSGSRKMVHPKTSRPSHACSSRRSPGSWRGLGQHSRPGSSDNRETFEYRLHSVNRSVRHSHRVRHLQHSVSCI